MTKIATNVFLAVVMAALKHLDRKHAIKFFSWYVKNDIRELLNILYLYRDTQLRKLDLREMMLHSGWDKARFELAWYLLRENNFITESY